MSALVKPEMHARRPSSRRAKAQPAPVADRWDQRYAELVAFKAAHGHCNVPSSHRENPSLAIWVFNCRRQRKQGVLDAARIDRLDAIDFVWSVRQRRFVARDWPTMVAELDAFRREYGHTNVPNGSPRHRELAAWLHAARCNKRTGRLDAERVQHLDALGVVWEPQQSRWVAMVAALAEYGRKHGDCNVPRSWAEDPALAKWVKSVRASRKRGEIDDERVRQLDAIGFVWDRDGDARWEEMFATLAEFRREHGHCRISTLSDDSRALGNWVHTQRTLFKQGRLDRERIARLDALGFTWDLRRERWDEMFAALEDYRRANGHCDVPQSWAENGKLGNWVMMQRAAYKAGRLDGEQIERLQAIGFHFSLAGDRLLVARPKKPRSAARPDKRAA